MTVLTLLLANDLRLLQGAMTGQAHPQARWPFLPAGQHKTGEPVTHHSDSVDDMVRYGKDIEKAVLARGLRYHLEDRVLVHGNKTVVFR